LLGFLLALPCSGTAQESLPSTPTGSRPAGTAPTHAAAIPAEPAESSPPVGLAEEAAKDQSAAGQPCTGEEKQEESCWAKVPPVVPLPRTGWFLIPPSGPGYYSLLDCVQGNYREKPPKLPYPPLSPFIGSFFDADFRYLEKPDNTQVDWFDPLKRI